MEQAASPLQPAAGVGFTAGRALWGLCDLACAQLGPAFALPLLACGEKRCWGAVWVYWLRTWILEPHGLAQVPAQPLPSYVTSDNPAGPQPTDLCNGNKNSNHLVGLS